MGDLRGYADRPARRCRRGRHRGRQPDRPPSVITRDRRRDARLLAGVHLGQAAVLLAQPPAALRGLAGNQGIPPAWIVRGLGIRTLVQAAAEAIRPRPDVLRVGIVVDLLHAASMLAAAWIWPRYRRAAVASAGAAVASAAAGALLIRQRQ
jgi:hypothetical protein